MLAGKAMKNSAKRFLLRAQGYKEIKDKEVLAKRSMIAKTPNVVKRAQLAPRNLKILYESRYCPYT